ncbi:MAG: hypothetical protein GY842_16505, partial [bacterium]|nr:hypothetical protein [bacterium]
DCEGDGSDQIGTCVCAPRDCNCSITGQSDYCGDVLSCPCPPGEPVCDTSQNPPECCAPYECPTTAGGECDIPHASCGSTVTCGCPDQYETCGGGGVPNECGCTPDTCHGRTGIFPDLCGGTIECYG